MAASTSPEGEKKFTGLFSCCHGGTVDSIDSRATVPPCGNRFAFLDSWMLWWARGGAGFESSGSFVLDSSLFDWLIFRGLNLGRSIGRQAALLAAQWPAGGRKEDYGIVVSYNRT